MDEIELAKSIFDEIVEETESEDFNKPVNPVAKKGGEARAAKLSDKRKKEIATEAAKARWGNGSK